jgi:hypothetical protein
MQDDVVVPSSKQKGDVDYSKWTEVNKMVNGRKRLVLRCKKTVYNEMNNKIERCKVEIRRDNYYGQKHTHIFGTMGTYIEQISAQDQTSHEIINTLCSLIGKQNISLRAGSSKEMYKLMMVCFNAGQNTNDKQIHFTHILPGLGRKVLTSHFTKQAEEIKSRRLYEFRGYASLAIDAGTVGTHQTLNIVLVDATGRRPPLLYKALRDFIGTTLGYKNAISKIIEELHKIGITVSGITTDNLRAQISAIDHRYPASLQNTSNNPICKSIVRVPCMCHTVSLGLGDLMKQAPYCDHLVTIKKSIQIMRRPGIRRYLSINCPTFCCTRWTNLYTIINHCCRHYVEICKLLVRPPTHIHPELISDYDVLYDLMFKIVPEMFPALLCYKCLIMRLESDVCAAAQVPIIMDEFKNMIDTVIEGIEVGSACEMLRRMYTCIEYRYNTTGNSKLLDFLSTFTLRGRRRIRHGGQCGMTPQQDEFDQLVQDMPDYLKLSKRDLLDLERYSNDLFSAINNSTYAADSWIEHYRSARSKPCREQTKKASSSIKTQHQTDESLFTDVVSEGLDDHQLFVALIEIDENERERESTAHEEESESDEDSSVMKGKSSTEDVDKGIYLRNGSRIATDSTSDEADDEGDEEYINERGSIRYMSTTDYNSDSDEPESINQTKIDARIARNSKDIFPSDEDTEKDHDKQDESFLDVAFEIINRMIGQQQRLDKKMINEIQIAYQSWMLDSKSDLNINHCGLPTDNALWQYMIGTRRWRVLGQIGQRALTIQASEACAERFFSRQEAAVGRFRTKTGSLLEDARMTFAVNE